MKEVTHEEWQKNPTPRMMWVWNSKVEDKVKRMVLHFTERNPSHPVVALTSDNITVANYKHCAEIENPGRMTNKEPLAEEQIMFEKEAEDFLKKSLKVDDDEFDFFKNEASCKEEIKRLTDFVESREKRIAELEKENAELKSELNALKTSER